MTEGSGIWEEWQELLHSQEPDLMEILRLGAQFQAYFSTIESETLKAARAAGVTWAELGAALGTSRQAVWQRATTWDATRHKHRSAHRPLPGEERLANLQREWADKRDKAAAAMFDGPPESPKPRRSPAS